MKIGISALALNVAVFGVVAPAAFAQDRSNQFSRERYTAVTDRQQPEYDPIPINLGGFELWSSVDLAARYNDNIYATTSNATADTYINLRPTAELRSKWSVHSLSAAVTVDHKEYLKEDSETVTDYNAYIQGRLDATRSLNFNGQVAGGRYSEQRYAPSSPGNAAEPTRFNRLNFDGGVNFNADRILLDARVGQIKDDYDSVPSVQPPVQTPPLPAIPEISQDFRDVTETFFSGRASYAVSPAIAVFVQGRTGELEYDHPNGVDPTRDATRTSIQVGANFEFAAPFRGDVAIGSVKQDNDDPTRPDSDGVSLNGRLLWFPTDITTVTFVGSRDVFDPGLRESSSAFNTNYSVRVDHELRRNILLFGLVGAGDRDYDITTTLTPPPAYTSRKDEFFDASLGVGYKLNRNLRLEAAYTLHNQKEDYSTGANRKFDQNIFSIGLKYYP